MAQRSASGGRTPKKKSRPNPPTAAELEIQSLVRLCRAGKLFEVQDWIAAGRPVNPPPSDRKGVRPQTPLEAAIDRGFHSLIAILVKAGADTQPGRWNGPMDRALQMRRLDIVQLLVEHGYDLSTIQMREVFGTWDPEIMEYFIELGLDVETDYPLAEALKYRIRTTLRVLKRYRERFPHFQKQANIALRHHCREGDSKWISLMLWAGADPYDRGSDEPDDSNEDEGTSALEFAALYRHFEVFKLKGVRLKPDDPSMFGVLRWAVGEEEGIPLAEKLLKLGVNPNNQENGGSSAIQSYLEHLSWNIRFNAFGDLERLRRDIDTSESRQSMKAIHVLARAGARWRPKDEREISQARRSLLKMIPEYTLEFVWLMAKYAACSKDVVVELLRTPTMKRHLSKHGPRLDELLSKFSEEETPISSGI